MGDDTVVRRASGLNILAGIWIVISPWVLQFSGVSTAVGNDIVVGIAILVLASIHFNDSDQAWASWVNLVLGIWMIVSSYVLGYSMYSSAWANGIWSGIAVVLLSVVALSSTAVMGPTQQILRRRGPTFTGTTPTEAELRAAEREKAEGRSKDEEN